MTPDFLVVGHIVKDITSSGWRPGGSVYYAAAQARRLGLGVAAVTSCASDPDPPAPPPRPRPPRPAPRTRGARSAFSPARCPSASKTSRTTGARRPPSSSAPRSPTGTRRCRRWWPRRAAPAPPRAARGRARGGCGVGAAPRRLALPAYDIDEIDATGAGDVFAAAFLIRYQETADAGIAARVARAPAALSLRAEGVSAIAVRPEIDALLYRRPVAKVWA